MLIHTTFYFITLHELSKQEIIERIKKYKKKLTAIAGSDKA